MLCDWKCLIRGWLVPHDAKEIIWWNNMFLAQISTHFRTHSTLILEKKNCFFTLRLLGSSTVYSYDNQAWVYEYFCFFVFKFGKRKPIKKNSRKNKKPENGSQKANANIFFKNHVVRKVNCTQTKGYFLLFRISIKIAYIWFSLFL